MRSEIGSLAEAYAQATSEAQQLDMSQAEALRQTVALSDARREVMSTLIKDLVSSRDAADALANALGRVGDRLIDWGISGLIDAIPEGSGGGLFKGFGGLLGFASGTANTGGRRGEVRGFVHGQEAVIPLPSGGQVPVQIQGGGNRSAQRVDVKVAVEMKNDGQFRAYVEKISQAQSHVTSSQMIAAAAEQERQTFNTNVQAAMRDPRNRARRG